MNGTDRQPDVPCLHRHASSALGMRAAAIRAAEQSSTPAAQVPGRRRQAEGREDDPARRPHTQKKENSWELAQRRRAQTMTECAKVRQATVFLVRLGPTETE